MGMLGFIRFGQGMSRNEELNALNQNFAQIEADSEAKLSGSVSTGGAVGDIVMTLKTTPSTDRLLLDGSTYNQNDYPQLWGLFSNNPGYFASSTSTTFTLVNMKGRIPVGLNSSDTDFNTLGKTGGQKDVQAHSHTLGLGNDANVGSIGGLFPTDDNPFSRNTGTTGTGTTNMNPYLTVNYEVIAKLS